MKFAILLMKNMIPEWIKLYLNYKLLKTYLSNSSKFRKKIQLLHSTCCKVEFQQKKQALLNNNSIMDQLREDSRLFIQTLTDEMLKIETFLNWKFQDLQQKHNKINQQIKVMKFLNIEQNIIKQDKINMKQDRNILKETCYNYFIELEQFLSYIDYNHIGIIKIIKKYKKFMIKKIRDNQQEKQDLENLCESISQLPLFPKSIKKFQQKIEKIIITNYYPLNPKKGLENLRKYSKERNIKSRVYFKLGLFMGFAIIMVAIILCFRYNGFADPDDEDSHNIFNKVFPSFRGIALFIIYYWFLALDLLGWTTHRINYKNYLGFNHHFSTVPEVFRRATLLSVLFLLLFIFYILQVEMIGYFQFVYSFNFQSFQFYPTQYLPLIVWGVAACYVFIPIFNHWNGQGRLWMYKMIFGASIGHFFKYESRYTFFLDQFTSMSVPLRDLDYTICYYRVLITTGDEHTGECYYQKRIASALVTIIPYSMKCIHYLTRSRSKGKFWHTDEMWNFFKTLLATSVGVLSYLQRQNPIFKYGWIPAALCASIWQYWWDLNKDWLFFEKNSKIRFLRNDLGYNKPYIYYFLGILNLFLRCTWVLSISPDMYYHLGMKNKELFILIIGMLEMSRRLINNFIKIEKEYITNLRSLKTTQDFKYPFNIKYLESEDMKQQINYQSLRLKQSKLSISNMSDQDEACLSKYAQYTEDIYQEVQVKEVNMEVINKAKQQEKFQRSKIKSIKQNQQSFLKLIKEV